MNYVSGSSNYFQFFVLALHSVDMFCAQRGVLPQTVRPSLLSLA